MLRSDPKKLLQEIRARFVDHELIPQAREIDEFNSEVGRKP